MSLTPLAADLWSCAAAASRRARCGQARPCGRDPRTNTSCMPTNPVKPPRAISQPAAIDVVIAGGGRKSERVCREAPDPEPGRPHSPTGTAEAPRSSLTEGVSTRRRPRSPTRTRGIPAIPPRQSIPRPRTDACGLGGVGTGSNRSTGAADRPGSRRQAPVLRETHRGRPADGGLHESRSGADPAARPNRARRRSISPESEDQTWPLPRSGLRGRWWEPTPQPVAGTIYIVPRYV